MTISATKGLSDEVRTSTHTFPSGEQSIRVEQFLPAHAGVYPGVLLLHGSDGLQFRGPAYREVAERLAEASYAAFLVHYFERTHTVYGDVRLVLTNFLPWIETVADALTFAGGQSEVDGERLGVIGFSLGAFMALSLATQEKRIKAVVDFFGGLPGIFAAHLHSMPPVLILHGETDPVVPVREAHKLAAVLRQRQLPYEMKTYPGAGHRFSGRDAQDALERVQAFLDQHLRTAHPSPRVNSKSAQVVSAGLCNLAHSD